MAWREAYRRVAEVEVFHYVENKQMKLVIDQYYPQALLSEFNDLTQRIPIVKRQFHAGISLGTPYFHPL